MAEQRNQVAPGQIEQGNGEERTKTRRRLCRRRTPTMLLLLALLAALCVASLGRGAYTQDDYEALISLKASSLHQPYVDSDLQNQHWDFGGDTIIDTSRGVRLTQDKKSQQGFIWTRNPIRARDFQITFEFAIHGSSHHLFGDGMALWLTADRAKQGNAFGNQGTFQGLGIAFDTYANGRHPYAFPRVMALQGTKYTPYVQDQDGANLEVGGCSVPFRDTPVSARGRLTYVDGEYLELQLHTKEWEEWETCLYVLCPVACMIVGPTKSASIDD